MQTLQRFYSTERPAAETFGEELISQDGTFVHYYVMCLTFLYLQRCLFNENIKMKISKYLKWWARKLWFDQTLHMFFLFCF